MKIKTVATAINDALHGIFETDSRVCLVGEDILDPYGGAFKISKGLSTNWPDRVLAAPISEAAIVGVCSGMALRGLLPIVEIMFGDFICLAYDQIVNHLAKFRMMYNNKVKCPIAIRTPMGGRRGYGPTHSQSLEKFLVGIPGIEVVAISPMHNIQEFYKTSILSSDIPTIIIENKAMYGQPCKQIMGGKLDEFDLVATSSRYPTIILSLNNFKRSDITIITYGGMSQMVLEAAKKVLIDHEIFVEVVILGQLSPMPIEDVLESVGRSGRVITIEEGTYRFGIGAEISSLITENSWDKLSKPVKRIAARDFIIPSAKALEDYILPNTSDIEGAIIEIMDGEL